MRVIIVGAGMVGTQLARHLVQEKHDVSIIESNEDRARHASNYLDCLVLQENGNSIAALREAGLAKADALVCVTGSDELNMIICGLAASLDTNIPPKIIKIARVRNDEYARIRETLGDNSTDKSTVRPLGIDLFIHPDEEAARAVLRSLSHGALGNILSFEGSPYELGSMVVAEGSPFDGFCLMDYRNLVKGESLITLVERGEESLLPRGSTVLQGGDRIHILAKEAEMDYVFSQAGQTEKPLRRIGIVGGGRLGSLIAEGLLEKSPEPLKRAGRLFSFLKSLLPRSTRRVTIIEQDYRVCKDLAARFPGALILNEDISDESFVSEERIGEQDLIITATANQEFNIIAAIYLKSRGVRRAIAMVSGSGYAAIARQLGVDVVIPLKSVVVDSIISRLMGGRIRGVHRLGDGSVGVIEMEIGADSPAAEKPITGFKLSAGGLVMLVNRGEGSFIPRGDYVFRAGDRIVLAAKKGSEGEIEKFFGAQK
jgi:trk system potassium uptake protein TrkA